MSSIVSLRHVSKRYLRGKETVGVLHSLDLDVAAGEFLALMGPSGSGKTTLLNLIGGLSRPDQGEISVAGERIDALSDRERSHWRAAAYASRRLCVDKGQLDTDGARDAA